MMFAGMRLGIATAGQQITGGAGALKERV